MNGIIVRDPVDRGDRGTFHGAYLIPKDKRSPKATGWRLLDLLLWTVRWGDEHYLQPCDSDQFAVVDVVTMEKAWFDMPHGCTPDGVTSMVSSCFGVSAYRVGLKLWFV